MTRRPGDSAHDADDATRRRREPGSSPRSGTTRPSGPSTSRRAGRPRPSARTTRSAAERATSAPSPRLHPPLLCPRPRRTRRRRRLFRCRSHRWALGRGLLAGPPLRASRNSVAPSLLSTPPSRLMRPPVVLLDTTIAWCCPSYNTLA